MQKFKTEAALSWYNQKVRSCFALPENPSLPRLLQVWNPLNAFLGNYSRNSCRTVWTFLWPSLHRLKLESTTVPGSVSRATQHGINMLSQVAHFMRRKCFFKLSSQQNVATTCATANSTLGPAANARSGNSAFTLTERCEAVAVRFAARSRRESLSTSRHR